jgi:hypothetical protein
MELSHFCPHLTMYNYNSFLHETLYRNCTQIQINLRKYREGNQKWTIQRNWQHSVRYRRRRKTKQKHNAVCVRQHYT